MDPKVFMEHIMDNSIILILQHMLLGIQILKEIQTQTISTIQSVNNGKIKKMAKKNY